MLSTSASGLLLMPWHHVTACTHQDYVQGRSRCDQLQQIKACEPEGPRALALHGIDLEILEVTGTTLRDFLRLIEPQAPCAAP